jgi:hypothetical protein
MTKVASPLSQHQQNGDGTHTNHGEENVRFRGEQWAAI